MGFSDKEVGWPIVTKLMQYCILHLYFSDLKCLYSLIKKSLVKCMPSKSFVMWNGFSDHSVVGIIVTVACCSLLIQ